MTRAGRSPLSEMPRRAGRRLAHLTARGIASSRLVNPLVSRLLRDAPVDDPGLRRTCEAYVNMVDGVGDDNPRTNGEYWLLGRVMPGCSVVVDAGAHRGDWTAAALAVNPGLAVHCFEPASGVFRELAGRELPPAVRRRNAGLGSATGQARLYLFEGSPALNSLYPRRGLESGWGLRTPRRHEIIDLIRLDDYCASEGLGRVDYLKLDIEGHELDALEGAARLFSEGRVRYGQFEYGGCNIDARVLLRDLFEWLDTRNYALFRLLPARLVGVPQYDQRLEDFRHRTYVFSRRDLSPPA